MAFVVGNLTTLARKHGSFGDYEVSGDFVADEAGKRGWLIDLQGLDSGTFTVVDDVIHRSGRHYGAGSNGEAVVPMSPAVADLRACAKQAIVDAIAKWEAEEREKPLT